MPKHTLLLWIDFEHTLSKHGVNGIASNSDDELTLTIVRTAEEFNQLKTGLPYKASLGENTFPYPITYASSMAASTYNI